MAIPSPEKALSALLASAPRWLQVLISNIIAVLQWIGLPTTILSFLSDRAWVVDLAHWAFTHSGNARVVLAWLGSACVSIVSFWHLLSEPIRSALSAIVHFNIPAWAIDLGTIAFLLVVGPIRERITFNRAVVRIGADLNVTPATVWRRIASMREWANEREQEGKYTQEMEHVRERADLLERLAKRSRRSARVVLLIYAASAFVCSVVLLVDWFFKPAAH